MNRARSPTHIHNIHTQTFFLFSNLRVARKLIFPRKEKQNTLQKYSKNQMYQKSYIQNLQHLHSICIIYIFRSRRAKNESSAKSYTHT